LLLIGGRLVKKRFIFIAALMVIAGGLAIWGIVRRARYESVAEMFGGKYSLQTVQHPTRVEACCLGPLPQGISWQEASLGDYPVTSGPFEVVKTIAEPASEALLSPDTYGWDFAKDCAPVYGVRLSFLRGSERIDVLFCFECDVLLVGRNGRVTGGEDFDFGRSVFVRAVKAIFPDNEVIQRLRENRRGRPL
jgi:hypothetical protein